VGGVIPSICQRANGCCRMISFFFVVILDGDFSFLSLMVDEM
jgi:hypothetical protein